MAPQKNLQYGTGHAFSSSNDALIFTTMCVVGMPVEVQVKDGSIYAGIFHTACIDNDYGIVLKMARMVRRGMSNDAFVGGSIVDTLVVLSGDLVQVVAKDVILPSRGPLMDIYNEDKAAISGVTGALFEKTVECQRERILKSEKLVGNNLEGFKEVDTKTGQNMSRVQTREVCAEGKVRGLVVEKVQNSSGSACICAKSICNTQEAIHKEASNPFFVMEASVSAAVDEEMQGIQDVQYESHEQDEAIDINNTRHYEERLVHKSHDSIPSDFQLPVGIPSPPLTNEENVEPPTFTNAAPSDIVSSNLSLSSSLPMEFPSSSYAYSIPPATPATSSLTSKTLCNHKSKLNPGAKTFSPSSMNMKATTPRVSTAGQVLDISHLPVVDVQPGTLFNSPMPLAASTVKYSALGNISVGATGHYSQTSQPMFGYVGSRQQPIRYISQYGPPQAGATYVHPSNQAVMVSRFGQMVYSPSLSLDHAVSSFPQGLVHPLLNVQSVVPKHHGPAAQPVQLCVPPPFTPGVPQPLAMSNHFPVSQPFPAIYPVPVASGTGILGSKFTL